MNRIRPGADCRGVNDELLVIRCQLGEREAFAELVRAWHDPVRGYLRRMLDDDRSDDVAQEVWLAVFRALPRLREPARFAPWLFTIARRAVTDRLRAHYAQPAPPEAEPDDDPADLLLDRITLTEALNTVPPREREVLILFHLQDLSLEDCAEICGVPAGTVKSRLSRARKLLRAQLEEKGYTP